MPTALLTLPEAKEALNITSQVNDNEVAAYLDAVTDLIEAYIGPCSVQTFTQTLHGARVFLLAHTPVMAVTSINGVLTGALQYDITRLTVNPDTGEVRRLDRGTFGDDLYTITYTAGRTVIPIRVKQAARVLLQHMWSTQRGSGGRTRGDQGENTYGMGFSMPNRVMELLTTVRIPGIA